MGHYLEYQTTEFADFFGLETHPNASGFNVERLEMRSHSACLREFHFFLFCAISDKEQGEMDLIAGRCFFPAIQRPVFARSCSSRGDIFSEKSMEMNSLIGGC
jgi:hypothetical protein